MALILALTHAQHGLTDRVYRTTALVWAAAAILVVTPFDTWVLFQGDA
jgi:hypothetical protein